MPAINEKGTALYSVPALRMPKLILFGPDSIQEIGKEAKKMGGKKVIIITDRILVKLGLVEKAKHAMEKEKIQVDLFEEIEYEPTSGVVDKALGIVRKNSGRENCFSVGSSLWFRAPHSAYWHGFSLELRTVR